MGNKIFNVEDTLVAIGAEILDILQNKDMKVDTLYSELNNQYVKKVKFDRFVYTLDFLYAIGMIAIKKDDIVGVK